MDTRSWEMTVFARVVELGSFSAAAEKLRLTPSAVSKLVTRTEERLGVSLLQRSTRQLTLTSEGRHFHEACLRILADIDEAEAGLGSGDAAPRGLLRVNTSVPFGTHHVVPLLAAFSARYPDVTVDLSLSDALVDLQREQTDVAIRMGPLADATFRARKLGDSRRAVVASPAYLARHGTPAALADLAAHRCLNFNFRRSLDEWPFLVDGRTELLPVQGGMLTNNGETMRQLVLEGLGIARLGMFHIARDLADGRLIEVLADFNPGDLEEIHVIFRNQKHMPARVRVFIDFLVERFEGAARGWAATPA
ncbi:LysR family transcriptional regulator [Pseudoduganella armeniaca]|uniref:LysR family transcriptional regulator n=1 Tax=Pseudoduganella armeniaca TaxID=2072590 RepID=A0A2R4C3U1_9BURK|nr:LysR family transcriptional regulator [Pseudoduganella armeniaca]AVR94276.1 LysR family transcriptional regulator [Pseudoduganella armeniaca]